MISDHETSHELLIKKEKMMEHQHIYKEVESKIYEAAGGRSIKKMLELQKAFKVKLHLKTTRVDWRTKTGIILWFCDNWDKIRDVISTPGEVPKMMNDIANSRKGFSKRPYKRRSLPQPNEKETLYFPFLMMDCPDLFSLMKKQNFQLKTQVLKTARMIIHSQKYLLINRKLQYQSCVKLAGMTYSMKARNKTK